MQVGDGLAEEFGEAGRVPVGVVVGHADAGVAHDGGPGIVGHVGPGGHAGGPVACAVDGDRRGGRRPSRPCSSCGVRWSCTRGLPRELGEYEFARAYVESFDARPKPLPQARGYGYEPVGGRVLGVVSHRMPYRCSALSQAGVSRRPPVCRIAGSAAAR